MEQQTVKSASEVVIALALQCNSPDCGRCPYWEFDNCKSRMKRDAVATIQALRTDLARAEKERDAAIEGITSLSVCEQCERICQGDDECIDNGYMNFSWRNPAKREKDEK